MTGRQLSLALKTGGHVYGTAILSPSPIWATVVASLELDFVFIDTEHTPLNRETVSWMCHTYKALNVAPLVRISSPDKDKASMAIDGGATGVIALYVETPEQVQELVGAIKHKPIKGEKLINLLLKVKTFEIGLTDYIQQNNQENILVINVESVKAIRNLDDILSVEGLDAILIGPHDLTCSLGIPKQYNHPLFKKSVERIMEKASIHQIGIGIHMWEAVGFAQEISWAKMGANLIMHGSDLLIFRDSIKKDLKKIKDALTLMA